MLLRTFTTSFFQAPGRLNLVEVAGTRVVIDYCHNVDGMRQLADFVNRMMVEPQTRAGVLGAPGSAVAHPPRTGRAIGVIGIPGDRRDQDQHDYGALAGSAFDEIIIREDKNLRGRQPGETAANVANGVKAARTEGKGRTVKVEKILEEAAAVRAALRRASPGDLIVVCADDAVGVYREAMTLAGRADGSTAFADPGEPRRRWGRNAGARTPGQGGRSRNAGRPAAAVLVAPAVGETRGEVCEAVRGVELAGAEPLEQREHGVALGVAEEDDDARRVPATPGGRGTVRPDELRLECRGLALVDGDGRRVHAARRHAFEDRRDDVLAIPAAQVHRRLLEDHPLRPLRRDPADPAERVVGTVAGGPDDRGHGCCPARRTTRDPAATSRIARVPASLWAKSTMIVRRPRVYRFMRPGDRSADGRKWRSPSATWAMVAPIARAPPAAASAFATLCHASPPRATGRSATSTISCSSGPSHSRRLPRCRTYARPPSADGVR